MPYRATPRALPARRALALLGAACLLAAIALPQAQAQTPGQLPPGAVPIETRPEPVPDPDADSNAKKPVPRAKRMQIKKTGEYIYKCGDEFTDQPVCANQTKAARIKLTPEDEKRCDDFRRGNFIPWYCRK